MQGLIGALAEFDPAAPSSAANLRASTREKTSHPLRAFADVVRYLLDTDTDTDICIYVIAVRPPQVLERFLTHEADGLGLSAVTVGELHAGVRKSGSRRNLLALGTFLAPLEVAGFGFEAACTYGKIRRALEKKGRPIGPYDM